MIGRKKNNRISIALTSVSIVLALLFTGLGYPGLMIPLIKKKQPEPEVYTTDQLLSSVQTTVPEEAETVLPAGNSQAFSITPQPGVTISAEKDALDHDRSFALTPCSDEQYEQFDGALKQNNPDMDVLYAWDLDAGLSEDETLPGTFHVDLDLQELGVFRENYPYLSAYRISDTGVWYEYAITIENDHLSFDSNKNCPITITGLLTAAALVTPIAAIGWNYGGSGAWLSGFDKMFVYEKGITNEESSDLGKKLYNVRIKFSETVEVARKKLEDVKITIESEKRNEIAANAKKAYEERFGAETPVKDHMAVYKQLKAIETANMIENDQRYKDAVAAIPEAVKKSENSKPLDFNFYKTFGEYCIKANKYLKEEAKVIVPDEKELSWYNYLTYNQVVDIYLNYDYAQGGGAQFTVPFGNYYVVVKGRPIMTGEDTSGQTLATLIHELLHVSQREYRGKATSDTKFDEATAQLIEIKAKDYFPEITSISDENSRNWQAYYIPLDSTSAYIDGQSVAAKFNGTKGAEDYSAGDQGYPLCHFIDHLLNNKKALSFGELLTAYGAAGGYTPTLKKAFEMDDAELTKQYKKFIKNNQTKFYELAAEWYANPNASNQWALSRKGYTQGERAVIKNQAYQTTVRRIYPLLPPEGRQKQISILLAYDDNYKELTDFELIPIGNKDYKNTKYGIMYDPKPYSKMNTLYTLEIDGGANTEDVTSGYTVWTLFAPKPIGDITLKEGMINFRLPEKSDAAKEGKIDGYRVTITCTTDGTKTEKFYKISGAEKDISLNAKNYKDEETELEDAVFRVSICEYIKEATGEKAFGPESDPSNSIVDDMEDTLEQMGAGHGKVNISLGWKTSDDLDLHVVTPNGSEIYYSNKSADGGVLDVDMQVIEIVASPAEHVDFASPPSGTYSVSVVNYTDRTEGADSPFVVVVEIEGKKKVYEFTAGGEGSRTSVCRFTYDKPEGTEKGNEHLDD